jgi:hypothetical protein
MWTWAVVDGVVTGRGQVYQGMSTASDWFFFAGSVGEVSRVVFRTGPRRREPTPDTEVDGADLAGAAEPVTEAVYHIGALHVTPPRRQG